MSYFNVDISKCMCCQDSTKFKNLVFEINNIRNRVEAILSPYEIQINKIEFRNWREKNRNKLFIIYNDRKHPHLMCGYCYQVNLDELTIAEDSLRNTLFKVFFLIQSELIDIERKKYLVNYILNLLAGNYPITYHSLDNFSKQHFNNHHN